jgi:hypothetical protein
MKNLVLLTVTTLYIDAVIRPCAGDIQYDLSRQRKRNVHLLRTNYRYCGAHTRPEVFCKRDACGPLAWCWWHLGLRCLHILSTEMRDRQMY